MSVHWSPTAHSYLYSCVWGCLDYDYDTWADAFEAFETHTCDGRKP